MTAPLSRGRRDVIVALSCAVFIVGSLLAIRLLATPEPDAQIAERHTDTAPTSAVVLPVTGSPLPQSKADRPPATTSSPTGLQGPVRTMQLIAGQTITPRPATPGTAQLAASEDLPATLPTPPIPPADSAANTAIAWITTLCTYDWQQATANDHQNRAATLGDTSFPAAADPFTFTDQAWDVIVRTRQSSTCVDTTATVEQPPPDRLGNPTVRIATTQILAADRIPFQRASMTTTRALEKTPTGWRIGASITAN